MPGHWICQICHKPIESDGSIEVINVNIDLDDIGAHPVRPTDEFGKIVERMKQEKADELGIDPREVILRLSDYREADASSASNAIVVRHHACVVDQDNSGYHFDISRAETIEDWVAWTLFVGTKSWMGKADVLAFLEFWWTHRGDDPPSV